MIAKKNRFTMKMRLLKELLIGVETLILPKMINAATPGGAPPRRIKTVEIFFYVFPGLIRNRIGS
jgi:hypothetical protein